VTDEPGKVSPAALKKIVEKIQDLPTLPPVVSRLLGLIDDPNSSARDVEAILSRDPSLTMKVMRLVNSPFYGYGNIKTVQQAVVILGFEAIRGIALSAAAFEAFPGVGRPGFSRIDFWRHSLAVGVAGRLLAQRAGWKDFEEAFVAGIIHDIGKVVLDEYCPELWERVLLHTKEHNCLIVESERAVLGLSHAQIGRWLASRWHLPPAYVAAIFYHHQPGFAANEKKMAGVIHVADVIARTLKLGSGGDTKVPPLDPAGWKETHLAESDLKEVLALTPEAFNKADLFLALIPQGKGT